MKTMLEPWSWLKLLSGYVDVDRVLRTNHDLPWLDDLCRYGSKGCVNGAEDNWQPVRCTVSIVYSDKYEIEDPINDRDRQRKVLDMNVYTCREMPPDAWMTRPSRFKIPEKSRLKFRFRAIFRDFWFRSRRNHFFRYCFLPDFLIKETEM
jgi:hypothetical protein